MAETTNRKEVRTHFSISHPIDPAHVVTLSEMDMSYALASTLIDWDDSRQPRSALAQKWDFISDRIMRFELSPNARWSDGKAISASEVKASFDRAKGIHGKDLKSLFDMVESIRAPNDTTLEFHLVRDRLGLLLLNKLTEPMFGVLKVKTDGTLDLSVSSGAFVIEKESPNETILRKNPHWPYASPKMADRIILRPPRDKDDSVAELLAEKWSNLTVSQSLLPASTLTKLRENGFTLWERNFDRVMLLTFNNGRLANPTGFQLFRYLQKALDHDRIRSGLGSVQLTNQIFAPGFPLHLDEMSCPNKENTFPTSLKGKKLRILIVPERVPQILRNNFEEALKAATGVAPEFREVQLNHLVEAKRQRDYDFYLGSYGVGDPNYEGALSYFFELNPPPIASGSGQNAFAARTAALRSEPEESKRLMLSRGIIHDAICAGAIVPLFHFSTAVVTRSEIDLSKIPTTDETVSFSKIRFKRGD